jgi:hypothetical protein
MARWRADAEKAWLITLHTTKKAPAERNKGRRLPPVAVSRSPIKNTAPGLALHMVSAILAPMRPSVAA